MITSDFIQLLKTFPKDKEIKFYCPHDRQYYYISNNECIKMLTEILNRSTIILEPNIPLVFYNYGMVVDVLEEFINLGCIKPKSKLKFIDPTGKEFMILQSHV